MTISATLSPRQQQTPSTPPRGQRRTKHVRRSISPELKRRRRLLQPGIGFAQAYYEINAARLEGRAATSTVEALTLGLRTGVDALGEPAVQRRLSDLSESQLLEVAERLQKLNPDIAPTWTADDVEVLVSLWSDVHD